MGQVTAIETGEAPFDAALAARICWYYFKEGQTQDAIAQRLGLTRKRVNRILSDARDSGLVQITITGPVAPCVALESRLVEQFGLRDAVVDDVATRFFKKLILNGTTTSTLSASATPPAMPSPKPMKPISAPCTMKIAMTLEGLAPSVRRIAMSACLSVTAMTSVETMLNAATATISERMMNIMFFSIATARKKLA